MLPQALLCHTFLLVGLRIRRPRFCDKQNKNKISDGHLKKEKKKNVFSFEKII
jgi:hypothetical protein